MQVIYGKIRTVDEDQRIISLLRNNKIEYFYLSRNQMKRYSPYLSSGLYVYLDVLKIRKNIIIYIHTI